MLLALAFHGLAELFLGRARMIVLGSCMLVSFVAGGHYQKGTATFFLLRFFRLLFFFR